MYIFGMANFWQKLKRPFFALAPMADVTDIAFREIVRKYSRHGEPCGGPDVFWTEFVSADGLASEKGREALSIDLKFMEGERPIVAQIFTSKPENMRGAAKLVRELGFDGLDINMGCPDRTIEKQGAGAALIKEFKLAQDIIRAAQDGAGGMPVSVKTRIGYNSDVLDEWLGAILETEPAVITVHARTRKDMSKVPARWEAAAQAVKLRDNIQRNDLKTLIIGNGDVQNIADGETKARETGADGVMIGRAIFGRPWLFSNSQEFENRNDTRVLAGVLNIMVEHTNKFEELLGGRKNFAVMKKHYKAYCEGFPGAKELRVRLMETKNAAEVANVVNGFLTKDRLNLKSDHKINM